MLSEQKYLKKWVKGEIVGNKQTTELNVIRDGPANVS